MSDRPRTGQRVAIADIRALLRRFQQIPTSRSGRTVVVGVGRSPRTFNVGSNLRPLENHLRRYRSARNNGQPRDDAERLASNFDNRFNILTHTVVYDYPVERFSIDFESLFVDAGNVASARNLTINGSTLVQVVLRLEQNNENVPVVSTRIIRLDTFLDNSGELLNASENSDVDLARVIQVDAKVYFNARGVGGFADEFVRQRSKALYNLPSEPGFCGHAALAYKMALFEGMSPTQMRYNNYARLYEYVGALTCELGDKPLEFGTASDSFELFTSQRPKVSVIIIRRVGAHDYAAVYKTPDWRIRLDRIYILHDAEKNHYVLIRENPRKLDVKIDFCPVCCDFFKRNSNHHCKLQPHQCFHCKVRFETAEELETHKSTNLTYRERERLGWACTSCKKAAYSEMCRDLHKCKQSYGRCAVCNYPDPDRKVTHVCFNFFCYRCKTYYHPIDGHVCPMKPLTRKEKLARYCYYDIESIVIPEPEFQNSEYVLHRPCMLVYWFNDEDEPTILRGFDCITDFAKIVYDMKDTTLIAHNGGAYDHPFLVRALLDIDPHNMTLVRKALRGGKILFAHLERQNVWLKDSLNFWPCSLDAIAKIFGISGEKGFFPYLMPYSPEWIGKPPLEYFDLKALGDRRNDFDEWYASVDQTWSYTGEMTKYCVQDVRILKDAMEQYRKDFMEHVCAEQDPLATVTQASLALNIFRRQYLTEDTLYSPPDDQYEFIREAYKGGAVETFARTQDCMVGREALYDCCIVADFNSLYPSKMFSERLPIKQAQFAPFDYSDMAPEDLLEHLFDENGEPLVGFIKCDITCPDTNFPVLCVRKSGRLIFFAGSVQEEIFCLNEIHYALSVGYTVTAIHKLLIFEESSCDIFKGYVSHFIKCKLEASSPPENYDEFREECLERYGFDLGEMQLNKAKRQSYKLLLNSLYGKMAQRNKSKTELMNPAQFNRTLELVRDGFAEIQTVPMIQGGVILTDVLSLDTVSKNHNTNIQIAAYITAAGRVALNKKLRDVEVAGHANQVSFCDTDSVGMLCKKARIDFDLGNHLGEFVNEVPRDRFLCNMVATGPKSYALRYMPRVGKSVEWFQMICPRQLNVGDTPWYVYEFLVGEVEDVIKCKGVSLKSNAHVATYKNFRRMATDPKLVLKAQGQTIVHRLTEEGTNYTVSLPHSDNTRPRKQMRMTCMGKRNFYWDGQFQRVSRPKIL